MLKALFYLYKSLQPIKSFDFTFQKTILNKRKCYVFEPKKSLKGIILVVHGMTVRGIDDPRIWKQCEIFRQLNYKVYLPLYPEIQKLNIKKISIKKISQDIMTIYKENQIPIKIFTMSFSGGLSIIASSNPDVQDKIDSLFVIGTYANIKTTFDFFFKQENIDQYGYFIILKNYFDIIQKKNNNQLKKAFYLAAIDNALLTNNLSKYFASKKNLKKTFIKYVSNQEFKNKIAKQIQNSKKVNSLAKELEVLEKIKNIKAKISLIHGKNDNVIPSSESYLIMQECKKNNIPVKLCITSILDHGNIKPNLGLLIEFYKLILTLNFFFK